MFSDSEDNVYQDKQNVHNPEIAKTYKESVRTLMKEPINITIDQTLNDILEDSRVTKETKEIIMQYCTDMEFVHSELEIKFSELLIVIWNIAKTSDVMVCIFNCEIPETWCHCFNGRLAKLCNVCNGLDDRVRIQITPEQQLNNIGILARRYHHTLSEQQKYMRFEMEMRGYDEKTILEWLEYL